MIYRVILRGEVKRAATLNDLRSIVNEWQATTGIGSSEWETPAVFCDEDETNATKIGFMSYNGRVWTRQRGMGEIVAGTE